MNYIAVAALTVIASFAWFAQLEGEVRKDYVKAGYIVIDKVAYRLVPAIP
jgi:hypothetical protein